LSKPRVSRFIPFLVVQATSKIQFNGQEYASADEMSPIVRSAYERAIHETPALHSGARLAAKLKARIIVNDTEFDHAGDMSVDDRHQYHEALEALFSQGFAVSVGAGDEAEKSRFSKMWLIVLVVSVVVGALYFWLRTFVG
jgi:hypothetical protein